MFFFGLLLIFVVNTILGQLIEQTFTKLSGKNEIAYENAVREVVNASSTIACAEACNMVDDCWSFGYHLDKSTCFLIRNLISETNINGTDNGWSYFVKTDLCTPPWVNYAKSCYYVKRTMKTFNESREYCSSLNSHLINIEDSHENGFAKELVLREGSWRHHWIGLSDEIQERNWLWYPSLKQATYTDWDNHEPSTGPANCAVIHKNSLKWHDHGCLDLFPIICEIEIP